MLSTSPELNFKYILSPTIGLNPSAIEVKLLKYKFHPTVGLNPSGIEVFFYPCIFSSEI